MSSRAASLEEDRAGLVERLRARQPEIEAAVLALVERLVASIAYEDERELEGEGRSPERRHAERVQRLLDGVPVDVGEFGYELDAWHLCVIATGASAEKDATPLTPVGRRRGFLIPLRPTGSAP